jgi:hypothetical protein
VGIVISARCACVHFERREPRIPFRTCLTVVVLLIKFRLILVTTSKQRGGILRVSDDAAHTRMEESL